MSVLKTCPYCGGHGYINQFEDVEGGCRAWANECIACKGTGAILVPETNADRIRRMSDEELSDIFLRADFCKCCEHEKDGVCNYICAYPNIPIYDGCKQAALTWMKQPAEEDT